MAVSANDNGIKILANTDGIRLLRTFDNLSYDASRTSETVTKVAFSEIYFCGAGPFLNKLANMLYTCLLQPTVGAISAAAAAAAAASAATSAGLSERATSVVTIAGMVCFLIDFGPSFCHSIVVTSMSVSFTTNGNFSNHIFDL